MIEFKLGKPCPVCKGGPVRCRQTKTRHGIRTRYLRCSECQTNGTEIVDIAPTFEAKSIGNTILDKLLVQCPACSAKMVVALTVQRLDPAPDPRCTECGTKVQVKLGVA